MVFRYRFSSLLALLQTFRDSLHGALGKDFDFSCLETSVQHAELFRKLRNALVHDGYQPIGLWVDGRYYLPVSFKRKDHRGNPVLVDTPRQDVETLALEYSISYCDKLSNLLETLSPGKKLQGPQLPYDWFQSANSHPVLQKFPPIELPSRENWPRVPDGTPAPLELAAIILREISGLCATRLDELEHLPDIPF